MVAEEMTAQAAPVTIRDLGKVARWWQTDQPTGGHWGRARPRLLPQICDPLYYYVARRLGLGQYQTAPRITACLTLNRRWDKYAHIIQFLPHSLLEGGEKTHTHTHITWKGVIMVQEKCQLSFSTTSFHLALITWSHTPSVHPRRYVQHPGMALVRSGMM